MKRRARRCLGVDIGSTSLKVAELSQDRSGVIVHRMVEVPLEVTPETPADARWEAVVQALRDLLRQQKITTRQAVFALPGHAVFVRRVRLPRTSEERMQRIIRFEARQQIPFPLEQTLLQYQVCSTDVEEEVEVLLVAIKREIVEHYMSLVRRLGLRPIHLGVSSFALFNFHMYDEGVTPEEFSLDQMPIPVTMAEEGGAEEEEALAEEEPPAKAGGGFAEGLKGLFQRKPKAAAVEQEEDLAEDSAEPEFPPVGEIEEVKAFVNVGANTMDLAIGRTGGTKIIGFARSIPLAGNQITRAIQERCGCESYPDAERIKREQTQVIMGDAPPKPDQYKEDACRAIMQTIDRMVAEIRRSLDFYISQPDGMAVDRLVLSGGQAALPNLAGYFEDRLGVPVETATDIHNPACRASTRADEKITNFLVGIGLALQGLGEACVTIDFLPEHLKGWIEFKRKNMQLVVQLALVGGMLFMASQTGNRMTELHRTQAATIHAELEMRRPLLTMYEEAKNKRMVMSGMVWMLKRSSAVSPDYSLRREYVFEILAFLRSVRPPDVFFEVVTMGPNGELEVTAYSKVRRSAGMLADAMNDAVTSSGLTTGESFWKMDPLQRAWPGVGDAYKFTITTTVTGKVSKIEHRPTPSSFPGGWGTPPPGAAATPAGPVGPSSDDES